MFKHWVFPISKNWKQLTEWCRHRISILSRSLFSPTPSLLVLSSLSMNTPKTRTYIYIRIYTLTITCWHRHTVLCRHSLCAHSHGRSVGVSLPCFGLRRATTWGTCLSLLLSMRTSLRWADIILYCCFLLLLFLFFVLALTIVDSV